MTFGTPGTEPKGSGNSFATGETGEGDLESERRGVSICKALSKGPPSFSLPLELTDPLVGESELMEARG